MARRIRTLDPNRDAAEIARLSLVVLHGSPALTYALFTVAFLKQVAVPTMARILYRRGHGDIMTDPVVRNDDTLVFFGQLLDHGPESAVGRAWIARLNDIHAHFPLRNDDSLYTLSTLALDPHRITADLARSPFTDAELESHWRFWRTTALLQNIRNVPTSRRGMVHWAQEYESREFAPSPEGRAVARSLIDAFGDRILPPAARGLAGQIVSSVCPPNLREVHDLPEPSAPLRFAVRSAVLAYVASTPIRPVNLDRSMVTGLGLRGSVDRAPSEVGYRRGTT